MTAWPVISVSRNSTVDQLPLPFPTVKNIVWEASGVRGGGGRGGNDIVQSNPSHQLNTGFKTKFKAFSWIFKAPKTVFKVVKTLN